MKKMVCEICGSQSIRKVEGVFVCQECGAEYSAEDAKKLLVEIDEQSSNKVLTEVNNKNVDADGKETLIQLLYAWALNISKFKDVKLWLDQDPSYIGTNEFWEITLPMMAKKEMSFSYHPLNIYLLSKSSKDLKKPVFANSESYVNDVYKSINEAKRFYSCDTSLCEYIDLLMLEKNSKAVDDFMSFFVRDDLFLKNSVLTGGGYSPISHILLLNDGFSIPKIARSRNSGVIADIELKTIYTIKKSLFGTKYYVPATEDEQQKYNQYLNLCLETINSFIAEHEKIMEYYKSHFNEICDAYLKVAEGCKELEKQLFVPYKYRSLTTVLTLIDMVKDGKASSWSDLINLYDTHQFRATVYDKLSAIEEKLDTIQNTLITGFSMVITKLDDIQKSLIDIDAKMNQIKSGVDKIRKYSFITMWNAL